MALVNDAHPAEGGELVGDPTETALLAASGPVDAERWPRLAELPFDSDRKAMTTFHSAGGEGVVALTKGAPEAVLARADGSEDAEKAAADLAAEGYRVLAFASRRWPAVPDPLDPDSVEVDLDLIGLAALIDPPRAEARDAIRACHTASIRPVMITGDHPETALTIARQLELFREGDAMLTGRELADIPAGEEARLSDVTVFARVSPAQKIRIVEALQASGEVVAMTGDGVNDAPALQRADIGVAMGKVGTDVAREAADMVLLDDDFATITRAVEEGRRIYDDIRKFVRYTMTSNAGEVWTLFLAPLLGLPIPLLPIQILWINLVTDGLPGLALAIEPGEPDVMRRPPRAPGESLFARGLWQQVVWLGLFIAGVVLAVQAWAIHTGSPNWQTMVFTTLVVAQLCNAFAIRSETRSIFRVRFLGNPALLGAIALTVAMHLAVVYVPLLQPIFHTSALSPSELALCGGAPLSVIAAIELEKWMIRRGWLWKTGAAKR
jgi:Ca2+-transporting ATPase